MAITYDNKANPGINTLSWSHNNSGSLLVVVCCFYDYADYVNSITYGGVALTQAVEKYTTNWQAIEIWYLVNPPTGTNTVSVSETSSSDSRYYSASFYGAGGKHTQASNNGSTGAGTVDITPTVNNTLLVAGLSHEDDTLPVANGEETIYAHDNGTSFGTAASYYIQTTAGTQTMDWTGGNDYWVAAAASFLEVTTATNINSAKANIRNITLQADLISFTFTTPSYSKVNYVKAWINQCPTIESAAGSTSSPSSVTVPSGKDNLLFIASVGVHQGTITAVTWNGNSLTRIDYGNTAYNETAQLWGLVNPTPGTGSLTMTQSGGTGTIYGYYVISNAKQELPATHNNADGDSMEASVSITPPKDNCLIIDTEYSEPVPTADSSLSKNVYTLQDTNSYENAGSSYYQQASAASKTMYYDQSYGGRWAMAIAAVERAFIYSSTNFVRANIGVATLTKTQYAKASIQNAVQKINYSKGDIWQLNTNVQYSKGSIYSFGSQIAYAKGNILCSNITKANSIKASILQTVIVNTYSNGYKYRRKATIDNTKVAGSSDFTDFTVLFDSTYNGFKSVANGGAIVSDSGYDIRFELTNGTKLSHEIEYYDASSGRIRAWVKIPTLYGSSDTEYYVYFGKIGLTASEENITGTWRSQDVGVWHLKENPGGSSPQLLDSTSNDGDLTTAGSMTSSESVDGKIYKAVKFLGAGDYASHADDTGDPLKLSGNSTATLRCWLNATSLPTSENMVMTKYTYASNNGWVLQVVNTGALRTKIGSTSYTTTSTYVSTGNTYMIHAVLTGGTAWRFYVNGQYQEQVTFTSKTITASTSPFAMACASDALGVDTYDFHGWIDEARVYTDDVSDDWITTEYNTENDPSTFYSLGSLETTALSSKANIPGSYNNRAKANIKYTESKVNYARGYIFSTGAQVSVSKANIRVNDNTKINSVKANIRFTWTKDVYVKASLVSVVSNVNYVKSNIWRAYTNINYSRGNVNVAGTSVVYSKANIKYSYTKVNYAKASLSAAFTDVNYVKASIIKVGNTKVNYSKASIYFLQTKINYVKADIGTKIYTYTAQTGLPTDSADLGTKYTTQNYTDVATLDGTRVSLNTTSAYYVIHQYKDKHSNSVATITPSWTGQSDVAASICTVYLQIYNVNSTTWETLDSDNTTAANTNINLIGSITTNMANYYATGGWVTCRVYQRNI